MIRKTTKGFIYPPPLIRTSNDPLENRRSIQEYYATHKERIPRMVARCAMRLMEVKRLQAYKMICNRLGGRLFPEAVEEIYSYINDSQDYWF